MDSLLISLEIYICKGVSVSVFCVCVCAHVHKRANDLFLWPLIMLLLFNVEL